MSNLFSFKKIRLDASMKLDTSICIHYLFYLFDFALLICKMLLYIQTERRIYYLTNFILVTLNN